MSYDIAWYGNFTVRVDFDLALSFILNCADGDRVYELGFLEATYNFFEGRTVIIEVIGDVVGQHPDVAGIRVYDPEDTRVVDLSECFNDGGLECSIAPREIGFILRDFSGRVEIGQVADRDARDEPLYERSGLLDSHFIFPDCPVRRRM